MTDWTNTQGNLTTPFAALRNSFAAFRQSHQKRRALAALRDAEEHTLLDIGVSREELERVLGNAADRQPQTRLRVVQGDRLSW